MPAKIAALDVLKAKLQKGLDDPALYTRDPKEFAKRSAALAKAEAEMAEAEETWLALEMQRESAEG